MVKIAVTGGVASGKSTVCNYFRKNGIKVVSLDEIARRVVLPGEKAYNGIIEHFGEDVVLEGGNLDRPLLRKKITADPSYKALLESIVQPEILAAMEVEISAGEKGGGRFAVIEIPLLFEKGLEESFDTNILVCTDHERQIRRLMERDNVSRDGAVSLISIQMPQEEKRKKADYIIENDGGLEPVYEKTRAVFKKIAEKFDNIPK